MGSKRKSIMSGKVKKGIIIFISTITLISVAVILIIHSYISKMNLVSAAHWKSETASPTNQPLLEAEDADTSLPNSPKDEINSLEGAIRKNMEKNSTKILSDKNVSNILLIGSDTRAKDGPGRSDVIILVSINKKTKDIVMTSFLRDIYLEIPGKSNNRVNAAYAYGGPKLLMDTLEQNFNIKVDQFVSIDFYSFIDVVDAVGGVTIDVTKDEIPVINSYLSEINILTGQKKGKDYIKKAGSLLLNGRQALAFSRNRYVGNGDFSRTERQRRVLNQIFQKVKKLNLLQMKDLLDIVVPEITTNLTEGQIFSLILSMPTYMKYDIGQWSVPVADSFKYLRIRGMAVLGLDFDKNKNEIIKRIYGKKIGID